VAVPAVLGAVLRDFMELQPRRELEERTKD